MNKEEKRKEFEERKSRDPQFRKDIKTMIRWTYLIIGWTILCAISLFFIPWNISVGVWLLTIGINMHIKREKYKQWYIRMYGIDSWINN